MQVRVLSPALIKISWYGGIGRHDGFKIHWNFSIQVQVLLSALYDFVVINPSLLGVVQYYSVLV